VIIIDAAPLDQPADTPQAPAPEPAKASRASAKPAKPRSNGSDYFGGGAAEDPIHTYLKEIGKVELLSAELEVEMAKRIEAGHEAKERLAAHDLAGLGEAPATELLPAGSLGGERRLSAGASRPRMS